MSETTTLVAGDKGFDAFTAPKDYEEFFTNYYGYTVGMVKKLGIPPQDAEDVGMSIIERFQARDFLTKFDPEFHIEHRGTTYQPRFQSLYNSFVETYVRGHRDRVQRQARREPTICDAPVGVEEDSTTWINLFGPTHEDSHAYLEEQELISRIKAHLVTVPKRSARDICDLPVLFQLIIDQIHTSGEINTQLIMDHFGISSTATHSWIGLLRVQIRVVLAEWS